MGDGPTLVEKWLAENPEKRGWFRNELAKLHAETCRERLAIERRIEADEQIRETR